MSILQVNYFKFFYKFQIVIFVNYNIKRKINC